MSDRGSPTEHAEPGVEKTPATDAPASAPPAETSPTPDPKPDAKEPAVSSPAEGAKKDYSKVTLAEVIKSAVAKPDDPGASPKPAENGKDKTASELAAEGEKPPVADPDDDTQLPFHSHPRWQEMKGRNKELAAQIETLTPDADQFRKIDTFMQTHHLSPDEVGDLFIVGAMAKAGDPRALQRIDEYRAKLALAIGEAIPPDIQAQVDSGEISEAAAKAMAKDRAGLRVASERETQRQQADEQNRLRENAKALGNAQSAAVGAWEVEARKLDPDFANKAPSIMRYAQALMQEHGYPRSAEQAVQLMKKAHSEVTAHLLAALPPKQRVARAPIAQSSNGALPKPKTLREAMEQALTR